MHAHRDFLFVLVLGLTGINIALLFSVLYVMGRHYSLFLPWRVLLTCLMVYTLYAFLSDAWLFVNEMQTMIPFFVVRHVGSRLLLSLTIWSFVLVWWHCLLKGRSHGG